MRRVATIVACVLGRGGCLARRLRVTMGAKPTVAPVPAPAPVVEGPSVAFVSDVEGDLAYFERVVALSDVLCWGADAGALPHTRGRLEFAQRRGRCCSTPPSYFVFGGDLFDNGPGDIRLAHLLTDFKRRHPDRVYLLMGNRDVNKLRFYEETLPSFGLCGPFWDEKAPDYREVLEAERATRAVKEGVIPEDADASSITAAAVAGTPADVRDTLVNRVNYMLRCTMGCPRTFEFRRAELALLGRPATDAAVAASFRDAVVPGPDGFVIDYLNHAQVAVKIGATLFTHGCVPVDSYKWVYAPPVPFHSVDGDQTKVPGAVRQELTVNEWVAVTNATAAASLREYSDAAVFGASGTAVDWAYEQPIAGLPFRASGARSALANRPGGTVLAMQCRPATRDRNTIVNSWYDRGALDVPDAIAKRLVSDGVTRVCVGHKPCGDVPLVHTTAAGLQVVDADTQHSDPTATDRRGHAVHAITLAASSPHTRVNGVLICGTPVAFDTAEHPLIGRRTADGWWVRAWVAATERYVLVQQLKYDFSQRHVTREEAAALFEGQQASL